MRLVLLAISVAFAAMPLAADDALARIVGAEAAAALRAGDPVRRSIAPDGATTLFPDVSSRSSIQADIRSFRPTVGVEMLRLIPWPGAGSSGAPRWLDLYNILHAVSTMKGTRYWSVTRGREETLFTQSYAIVSPESARRIDDPVFGSVPAQSTFFTFQEDKSFGRNTYVESFSFPGDSISVTVENLSTVTLVLIPVIQPRAFVIRAVVLPAAGGLLFYGAAVLRTGFPIGNRRSREDSLSNRLIAMTNWLETRLEVP